ncbi:hypothetical protein C8R43DRAFT_1012137 [Mycena crocata]|nr:hypothetical protein C8R43DRAFT_1012137 [Mycena crocata]
MLLNAQQTAPNRTSKHRGAAPITLHTYLLLRTSIASPYIRNAVTRSWSTLQASSLPLSSKSVMEKFEFKVLIGGGSIAGLALANMLEQLGIDFLILEAYPEIASQVGASTGFTPNGSRILFQIGCYDGIRGKLDGELMDLLLRRKVSRKQQKDLVRLKCRIGMHGYGFTFVDRQMELEVFYGHLKDKSKVLVNKCVASVTRNTNGVQVRTEDGSTYSADILVGADGVHIECIAQSERKCGVLAMSFLRGIFPNLAGRSFLA